MAKNLFPQSVTLLFRLLKPPSMGRYGDLNYQWWTKIGFLLSVAVFAIGAGGELLAATMHWSLPAWENTLFVDMEILGALGMLFVPFVFGIALPLTE